MNFLKNNWLIIAVVLLFGGNLLQYVNPVIKVKEIIKRDTITTVKIDSVSLIRAKAELNYLRSELKQANGKIVYKTKTDTVEVNNTKFIVPNFTARVDTTFERGDYLTAKYEYPQNRFTILHKYPYTNTQINEVKTITEKNLFTFNHGIQVGFGYGVISQTFDTYLGYGFQLSF